MTIQLTVTAIATPNPANSGDYVTFACAATGGSGTYSYSWDGQFGPGNPYGQRVYCHVLEDRINTTRWSQSNTQVPTRAAGFGPSQGSGNGTVSYIAQPNAETEARSATISVGDKRFVVNQVGKEADSGTSGSPRRTRARYSPVAEPGARATSSGVPWAIT